MDDVSLVAPAVHRQRLVLRVDDPVVRNAGSLVREELRAEIGFGVRARQDLGDPVGTGADRTAMRAVGDSIAAPTDEVRAIHLVGLELDLDFGRDPPAAGSAASALER